MSDKKYYEEPKVIYEQKVELTGGGCALESGTQACEDAGYVITPTAS